MDKSDFSQSDCRINRRQLLLGTSAAAFLQFYPLPGHAASDISVFDQPIIVQTHIQAIFLIQRRGYAEAAKILQALAARFPSHGDTVFLQAVAAFRLLEFGKGRTFIEDAVKKGFDKPDQLRTEASFKSVHERPWFHEAIRTAERNAARASAGGDAGKSPTTLVVGGESAVTEQNTAWDASAGLLRVAFQAPEGRSENYVVGPSVPVHERVNSLYASGKSAGNVGDLYVNLDRGHAVSVSQTKYKQFTHVVFPEAAKANQLDYNFNLFWFFNRPAIGNASLGANGGSIARVGLGLPLGLRNAYRQYRGNQLFVYPAVNDHLPKSNEDNFPFNVPYLFVSQGASGSDGDLVRAAGIALACFTTEVKDYLVRKGLLMPTVQQIVRHALVPAGQPNAYLTSAAHPVAIDGKKLNLDLIVKMASEMRIESIPPLVDLTLVGQPVGVSAAIGTPNAVALVVRGKRGASASMSVAATVTENSVPSDSSLEVIWTVLQAESGKVNIVTDASARRANINVLWHDAFVDPNLPGIKTKRVDIGVFARRGGVVSAPSFISVAFEGMV